jgi:cytochrome o ubiquinol oxidase subunit II
MTMNKKYTFAFLFALALIAGLLGLVFVYSDKIAVLNPKGPIALQQRDLIIIANLLMLIVVIPVFVMAIIFCVKYRVGNIQAKYTPHWDHSLLAEAVWWGIPGVIILIMSTITWTTSHELDPFKPLDTAQKPLIIQVIALQWKWLFIYPEQNIATVNFFHFPEKTPINFEITADAPMNSFWIPQLAGQVYAMPGMKTQLHLLADELGSFRGSSANLSGQGFAGMTFIAKSVAEEDFNRWVQSVAQPGKGLDYLQLVQPSENDPPKSFLLNDRDLFDRVVMKYMAPIPSK